MISCSFDIKNYPSHRKIGIVIISNRASWETATRLWPPSTSISIARVHFLFQSSSSGYRVDHLAAACRRRLGFSPFQYEESFRITHFSVAPLCRCVLLRASFRFTVFFTPTTSTQQSKETKNAPNDTQHRPLAPSTALSSSSPNNWPPFTHGSNIADRARLEKNDRKTQKSSKTKSYAMFSCG